MIGYCHRSSCRARTFLSDGSELVARETLICAHLSAAERAGEGRSKRVNDHTAEQTRSRLYHPQLRRHSVVMRNPLPRMTILQVSRTSALSGQSRPVTLTLSGYKNIYGLLEISRSTVSEWHKWKSRGVGGTCIKSHLPKVVSTLFCMYSHREDLMIDHVDLDLS